MNCSVFCLLYMYLQGTFEMGQPDLKHRQSKRRLFTHLLNLPFCYIHVCQECQKTKIFPTLICNCSTYFWIRVTPGYFDLSGMCGIEAITDYRKTQLLKDRLANAIEGNSYMYDMETYTWSVGSLYCIQPLAKCHALYIMPYNDILEYGTQVHAQWTTLQLVCTIQILVFNKICFN